MKLHYSQTSPFARKVLILIHEAGLADRVEIEESKAAPIGPVPPLAAHNPLGKIPTLELADGPSLYDSRVITRYLDDLAGTGFYPAGQRLWSVLLLEALADGICDAAVSMAYEKNLRPAEFSYPDWIEGQWTKVDRALSVIEDRWLSHLAGPLDVGQMALGAALGYLDLRHGARNWREGRPGLSAWHAKIAERPSMQKSAPPV